MELEETLISRLKRTPELGVRDAIVWRGQSFSYRELFERVDATSSFLTDVAPGAVVALKANFTPASISLFLALVQRRALIVLIGAEMSLSEAHSRMEIAGAQTFFSVVDEEISGQARSCAVASPLYEELRRLGHAGLILFSSGSSGTPKASVHDLELLLEKFRAPKKPSRVLAFLLFDHIGGVNTLFHSLASGGCLVTTEDRQVHTVLKAMEEFAVEILPTTPTFLRLLMASQSDSFFDLRSLKTISYGTEPMTQSTLDRLRKLFPQSRLVQTYGLTELGILRARSKSDDSLWIQLGDDDANVRVREGRLEIKAKSSMLGYLNAESPFTIDGWFKTNDVVECDGEWLKIMGRASDLINVGGEKVYPVEVETILAAMPNVLDVKVTAKASPITGELVQAYVVLQTPESTDDFRARMKSFCAGLLPKFKIPQKVVIEAALPVSPRMKTQRPRDLD